MEERMDDIIERYLRNELTEAERQGFESRAATDASFREEVELHRKAMQAVRLQEKETVMAKLAERGRQLDAQAKPAPNRKRWWLGGAVLAMAALFWWQSGGEASQPGTAQPPLPAVDSLRAPNHSNPESREAEKVGPTDESPQNTPPIASSKERHDKLFAQHFQPYKDETVEPTVRGGEELSASQRFALLYWEGQYKAALEQFDKLPDLAQKNDNQLFIKAECLLATGRPMEAADLFAQLQTNGKTRFEEEVDWHLALALLKSGDVEQAKAALRGVAAASSPWQVDAKGLLEQL